jgi:hypothetical protein
MTSSSVASSMVLASHVSAHVELKVKGRTNNVCVDCKVGLYLDPAQLGPVALSRACCFPAGLAAKLPKKERRVVSEVPGMNTKFGTSLILILILTFHFDFDLTLTFSDNIHDVHMMCVCTVEHT